MVKNLLKRSTTFLDFRDSKPDRQKSRYRDLYVHSVRIYIRVLCLDGNEDVSVSGYVLELCRHYKKRN